jgi:hypothetical protein
VPLDTVAQKYTCTRALLQSLQQQASSFAGMVVTLCDRLGWVHMRQLLTGFAERVQFGEYVRMCSSFDDEQRAKFYISGVL